MVISPTFMGAEPDVIDEGKHKGLTLFRGEELGGLRLMQGLEEGLRKKAQLYEDVSDGTSEDQGPAGLSEVLHKF